MRFLVPLALVLMLGNPLVAGVARAADVAAEYELKAAFLFNFAKFVEWRPDVAAADALCIGIVGRDPFGAKLDQMLADKLVLGKPIEVRRYAVMADAGGCHVLFVGRAAEGDLTTTSLAGAGALTVGESREFIHKGGIIAFEMVQNKLRFEINAAAAERAGLKLSSQLLKLASRVVTSQD